MIALADGTNKPGNFNQRTFESLRWAGMFLKEMFTLRKNGSERAESTNSDYVKGTAVQAPLIMLPSSLFQADLSDCRVILEKRGSLAVLAFRVHRPRALWTMPSRRTSLQGHRLPAERTLSHLWMKEMRNSSPCREFWKWAGCGSGRKLYIPNLLRSSRLNFCDWVWLPWQTSVGTTTWWCSCFCSSFI